MKDLELNELLRKLPAVHELVEKITDEDGTPATILMACRAVLENERASILEGGKPQSSKELSEKVLIELYKYLILKLLRILWFLPFKDKCSFAIKHASAGHEDSCRCSKLARYFLYKFMYCR